jgi:large subunit ribosomal protein L44e
MNAPKKIRRYCPFCKKHTEHKVSLLSTGQKRPATKKGAKQRARKRGRNRGKGNKGRWSKPAVSKYKRKTKSTTKKVLMYTCKQCKKSKQAKKGIRLSKLQLKTPGDKG